MPGSQAGVRYHRLGEVRSCEIRSHPDTPPWLEPPALVARGSAGDLVPDQLTT
jgi:hypothetical protein